MKKLLFAALFLGVLLAPHRSHASAYPLVQITTGTLQPNTTNGFYVSSGTVENFRVSTITAVNVYKPDLTSWAKIVSWSSGTRTSAYTTSSTAFQGVASSCTITPSSTANWVVIFAAGTIGNTTAGQATFATIGRNGAELVGNNGLAEFAISSANQDAPVTLLYVDHPNTTSATKYQPMVRVSANTGNYCDVNTTCTTFCFELAP